ncbi:ABC transporter permease [Holophaga foetida]|uniref:ABC transporter permease n=1 Tax=Holophaga foetida TaxID=35839 RepID=UPI00024720FA|nr:FtsX-like permease family protein [Holophaga foetida]
MNYLHLILRSLLRSKRRTVLTVLSLAVSVALVAVLQSVLFTLDSFTKNPNASNRIAVRHKVSITNLLPIRHADWIRRQPGVEAVMGLQWFQGVYIDRSNFFPNFATEAEYLTTVFREEIVDYSESQFRDFMRDRNGCIAGQALADKYGWKVGDVITLKSDIFPITVRLTLRGTFRSRKPSDEQALHFHYKLLEEGVSYMKGHIGNIWVRARHPEDVPGLIERIDRHFADAVDPTTSETENAFQLTFLKMMGNYSAMIQSITAAVLVAILVVTANTMAMAIRERTTEIAVFRAMGFTGLQVLGLLMAEGVLLSVLGGGLGLGIAWLMAGGVRQTAGTFLPYLQDFTVPGEVLMFCLHATMGVGLLSTFIPAYRATRRPIIEGLRAL